MAKRYLKASHYRLSCYIGDRVLASGDALFTPGAVRIVHEFNRGRGSGLPGQIDITVCDDSEFIGIEPPTIIRRGETVG